jgi:hypothetical protein
MIRPRLSDAEDQYGKRGMGGVWWDVAWTCVGLLFIALGLLEQQPCWVMALLGFATGMHVVFSAADYRDVLRRQLGRLHGP